MFFLQHLTEIFVEIPFLTQRETPHIFVADLKFSNILFTMKLFIRSTLIQAIAECSKYSIVFNYLHQLRQNKLDESYFALL